MPKKRAILASVGVVIASTLLTAGVTGANTGWPKTNRAPIGLKGITGLTSAEIARWNRLVAAARQEGQITIISTAATPPFFQAFSAEFGINVTVGFGSQALLVSRVLAERQQGLHLEDVSFSNSGTTTSLLQGGVFQPMLPNIILSANLNRSKGWFLKAIPWSTGDPTKNHCTFGSITPGQNMTLWYNTNDITAADAAKITKWTDLLNPKYRGKVVIGNVGLGVATGDRELGWKILGKGYWQKFMSVLQPTVLPFGGDPIGVNGLARGQWDFAMFPGAGAPWRTAAAQGLPIALFTKILKPRASAVLGSALCLFNSAPHQAAAELFANWFLAPEGQAAFNRFDAVDGDVALRTTAPRGSVVPQVWALARKTTGVFVASNNPKVVNDSLSWWQQEMSSLGIH